MNKNLYIIIVLCVLLILAFVLTYTKKENFTSPGLTLIKPPNWFPQNSAKHYNKKDWKTKMYLERYPMRENFNQYKSYDKSNKIASAYRFWRE